MPDNDMPYDVRWLDDDRCRDPARFGGKVGNLAALQGDFAVPPGYALSVPGGQERLARPDELLRAYDALARRTGRPDCPVAVRSSAAEEDGTVASFAGQHDSVLNVSGHEALLAAVGTCLRSFGTDRVRAYRRQLGLPEVPGRVAVLVQQMVPADVSGVLFSRDPVVDSGRMVLTTSWGLGPSVVAGTVTPDTFAIDRSDPADVVVSVAEKRRMTVLVPGGVEEVDVPQMLRRRPSLTTAQAAGAGRLGLRLEELMGWPVDLELAWAGDQLLLLQCRRITALDNATGGIAR